MLIVRGRGGWSRLALWRLDEDRVETGPPLRARIWERKCDLAPDGALLLYAARGHGPDLRPGESGWTAVSRPPAATADLFAAFATTYGGGGLFAGPKRLWIAGLGGARLLRAPKPLRLDGPPPAGPAPRDPERRFDWLHWRLLRGGWVETAEGYAKEAGGIRLEKRLEPLRERHAEIDPATGAREERPEWDWADFDGADLVHSEAGAIWRRPPGQAPQLVAEFGSQQA